MAKRVKTAWQRKEAELPLPEIRILDAAVAGRIAAGEVVERPASAAKELIENALDAGATAVSVTLEEGGLSLLRVSDNGCGMGASDAALAFTRHATSKLPGDDLVRLRWLGFRGEALPSIAAVSKLTLRTRARGAGEGVRLIVDQGIKGLPEPAGCPEGTIIEVEGLFACVPARLKFMKRPTYEAAAVADLIADMVLLRPDVSFRLESDGKTLLRAPGGTLRDAALAVYGPAVAAALIEIHGEDAYIAVGGLIGVGDAAHANRSRQTLCVNGRVVRSAALSGGLEAAVRDRVLAGRFPLAALHVSLPDEQVDVNVHPNKMEVRFRDEGRVRQAVSEVVRASLAANRRGFYARGPSAPVIQESAPPPRGEASARSPEMRGDVPIVRAREREEPAAGIPSGIRAQPGPLLLREGLPHQLAASAQPRAAERDAKAPPLSEADGQMSVGLDELPMKIIGSWHDAYILLEAGDSLLIVDQHAGHERLLFDRLTASFAVDGASQPLLLPLTVALGAREKEALLAQREALSAVGLEVEDFGPRDVRVTAVPHILGAPQAAAFVREAAARLGELGALDTREARREALARMACRAAVKAGDKLSPGEMRRLIGDLNGAPPTCPHGRPIYLRIDRRELEKRFGRIP